MTKTAEILSNTSLTLAERVLLASLITMPNSTSSELGSFVGFDRANTSRKLNSLVRRGFVTASGNGKRGGRYFTLASS